MKQTSLAFQVPQDTRGYQSEAERQFLFGLIRAGWIQTVPANDNGHVPLMWKNDIFEPVVLLAQLDLDPILGIEHVADYVFRSFSHQSLVVEIDGDRWHTGPRETARDKRLDRNINSCHGWMIYRYPAREVLDHRTCDQAVRTIHAQLNQWIDRHNAVQNACRGP